MLGVGLGGAFKEGACEGDLAGGSLQAPPRLEDGGVALVHAVPLLEDAARGRHALPVLPLPHPPRQPQVAVAGARLLALGKQRPGTVVLALPGLHDRPRLPERRALVSERRPAAQLEPLPGLLVAPHFNSQHSQRLIEVRAGGPGEGEAGPLDPQVPRALEVALALLQHPPCVPGRHMPLIGGRRGVEQFARVRDLPLLGL
mmetsp:Transcript_34972/g.110489  ORF Transcript_34972/g.110489 Transcript_34972/m.110489 type:complete len:201 (-) Transcript_34972:732-1334(-)